MSTGFGTPDLSSAPLLVLVVRSLKAVIIDHIIVSEDPRKGLLLTDRPVHFRFAFAVEFADDGPWGMFTDSSEEKVSPTPQPLMAV